MNLFGHQTSIIMVTYGWGLMVAEIKGSFPLDGLIKLTRDLGIYVQGVGLCPNNNPILLKT